AEPPLIRIPFAAPTAVPTMMAVGVASPRAQGQLMTTTDMAKSREKSSGSSYCWANQSRGTTCDTDSEYQVRKVVAAMTRISGVNTEATRSAYACTGALLIWAASTSRTI